MERTPKKRCTDAPYLDPLHRPKPELFDGINRAARKALIDRLGHWNYLSTWERGKRFVVKLRDLREWELVYRACSHMTPGRRKPDLHSVGIALFAQANLDVGWAFLAFIRATGELPCIPLPTLFKELTEQQARLIDQKTLKRIAALPVLSLIYKPFQFPVGRQILIRAPHALPLLFFTPEDYASLVCSKEVAEQLCDEALVIAQNFDLGAKGNHLVKEKLEWRDLDISSVRDLQRGWARAVIKEGPTEQIGSPLCPMEFAIELLDRQGPSEQISALCRYFYSLLYSTPQGLWRRRALARIADWGSSGFRQPIAREKFTPSCPLNKDIWQQITQFLDSTDLHRLARTCTGLYNLIHFERANPIWRAVCEREFPYTNGPIERIRHFNSQTHHNMWLSTWLETGLKGLMVRGNPDN